MKSTTPSARHCAKLRVLTLAALAVMPAMITRAANVSWTGPTASYTNAANWNPASVPGASDTAINDNGSGNVVQINAGNPDWIVTQILAGNSAGNGAFEQNAQTVNINGTNRGSLRLGLSQGRSGVYTLNGGAINYTGQFNVGEGGTGTLNVNGGTIAGSGIFAVNVGSSLDAVNATVDGGASETGFTWFEQGAYIADGSRGVPTAGSTFVSQADANTSYTMAPSFTANNSVMLNANAGSATVTLATPTACSALSFLGSAGNGAVTVNYIVHHADSSTETGSFVVPDWFGSGTIAWTAGGRVPGNGLGFQIINSPNFPYLFSINFSVVNTASPVTSVDLNYASGGVACLLAVSSSTGGTFAPVAITGYNADMIVEAGAAIYSTTTSTMNQTNGAVNLTGEFWVGNGGAGVYNLSGGAINVTNWFVVGRTAGGNGTMNMTGGSALVASGGQPAMIIGDGASGTLNHSAGTIATTAAEFWIGNGGAALGTNNMSGTAQLNVGNWIAIGRGGVGVLNLSGNAAITKTGGGNIVIPGSGVGIVNQSGGSFTVANGQIWLPEGGNGTWNLTGGAITAGVFQICRNGGSQGVLNLDGGTVTVGELTTGNVGGFSTLNLNGGTIIPTASSANFLHDLTLANVGLGGAIFNTAGFDVTVAQALADAGGGLTKNGAGKLTLTGANSYSGATTVNAGKLVTSTAATAAGDVTVADNAGFGVTVVNANGQVNAANFTIAGPTAASLDFNLGGFGNPTAAPLNVVGTFSVNGPVTVNITDDLPQLGQFPLVAYATRTGSGNFVLGTVPVGLVANIVTNGNTIALNITTVNLPRWDGASGNNWDIGLTSPWINIGTGLPTTYGQGNFVLFDDNATGSTAVNLTTTVNPGSVTVNNTNLVYTFIGSGKISGSIGLSKQGTGTLALHNTGGNNYTGVTVISNGVLSVTNLANGGVASPIGAASASPTNLIIGNGSLQYAGAPVAVNRGVTLTSANSAIDVATDLTMTGTISPVGARLNKTGAGVLTYAGTGSNLLSGAINPGLQVVQGTLVFNGAGAQTNRIQNEMWVGGTPNFGGALILSNTFVTIDTWLGLGRGNGTVGNTSSISLYNSTISANGISFGFNNGIVGNLAFQNVSLNGNSAITNRGGNNLNIAESAGSTAVVDINNNSIFQSAARCQIAGGGATGVVTIANSGQLIMASGTFFSLANGNGAVGTMTLKDSANLFVGTDFNVTDTGSSRATFNIQDSATASGSQVYLGKQGLTVATINISGGTITARGGTGNHIHVGQLAGAQSTINMTGGTVASAGEIWVGEAGTANWTQTGGAVWSTNWVAIGRNNTNANGSYTISGGSFAELDPADRFIVGSGGTGALTISGTAQVSSAGTFQIGELLNLGANPGQNGKGTVNLNGGTLTVPQVTRGAGTATFNFNGGNLVAANNANATFLNNLTAANVLSGGANINTGTNNINIGQALLDGGTGGGLTKSGTGMLRLNGVNTYTGATAVNAGTLAGTGTIAGAVNVAAGATLAPGASIGAIGTLTVGGAVTLAAGSTNLMEISKNAGTNDLVAGSAAVTYGGTLVIKNLGGVLAVNDTFKLFNGSSYSGSFSAVVSQVYGQSVTWDLSNLTVNGTVRVASVVAAPVQLTSLVSGNNLNLSWPADQLGWRLEVQTNALSVGLTGTWFTVANSSNTTAVVVPVVPGNPTVFYRLVYP